jgi:glycosyltransferase involved in cell wall biosynthesis
MLLSVVIPCFNEQDNVIPLAARIAEVLSGAGVEDYELLFIDNASVDETVARVKALCAADRRVRLIVNARNFGHVRSPYHAILQARGDAVVCMAADFQDPPEMLASFVAKWREGYKVVVAVKQTSRESRVMWALRSAYYRMSRRIADVELIENYTGFGLYDREFVEIARSLDDPYPYFRGLIAELGLSLARVPYTRHHQEQLLHALRRGDARHHQPLEGADPAGDHGRIHAVGAQPARLDRLLRAQAALLGQVRTRHRAAADRVLLLRLGADVLHRADRRVCRRHPHPGHEAAAGGREGARELR